MKLVKLARDSAAFLIKRKSPWASQGKLVRCTGCDRQKLGGPNCRDHMKLECGFVHPKREDRTCLECKQELAAWVKGDVCSTCLHEKIAAQAAQNNIALHRQQMMQLYAALGQQGIAQLTPAQSPLQQMAQAQQHLNAHRAALMAGFAGAFGLSGYAEGDVSREAAFRMEPKTVIGPILAYRSWRVRGGKLASLNGGLPDAKSPFVPKWQPKEPMTGEVREHGVYAHRLPKHIERDPKYVSGGVWLWGDVIEHENGFRASFGYPAFLWAVDDRQETLWEDPTTWSSRYRTRLKSLAEMYEIPLFAVDSLDNLPEREGLRERLLLS